MKLQDASKFYVGASPVAAVYAGANKVWASYPAILNSAVAWIDATQDTARADGSTITSYTSHSTSAKVLAAVATREPIFRANVGGKPRIAFTSDILQLANYQPPVTGMTYVMVSRKIVIATYCELIAYRAHEMRVQGGQFTEGTMTPIFPRSTVSEATSVDYLHVVEFNNTTHACRVWINGLLTASGSGAAEMVRTAGNLNFGGRDQLDLWGDITVSEAAVFDGMLSDADRVAVSSHLMTKWSITPMVLE